MSNPLSNRFQQLLNADFYQAVKYFLLLVVLVIAVITRLAIPSQPAEALVFDEAYFVPQVESYSVNRYFFDIHPPLGKMLMHFTTELVNPNAEQLIDPDQLANKVDGYETPLDLTGIRLAPKITGVLLPGVIFLLTYQLLILGKKNPGQSLVRSLLSFGAGLFVVFANIIVVESRFGLLTSILLFFMFLALYLVTKYFNAKTIKSIELWFIAAAIGLGLALSVKWLTLSITPIFVLLILVKEFEYPANRQQLLSLVGTYAQRFAILIIAALAVYLGTFYWHFNQIENYSPAAYEVTEAYQEELRTGETKVSFLNKVVEWHQIAMRYSDNVPALDYSKPDEIGSMWATWPIMARPISYYWQTDGDNIYDFIYLIGNPVLWTVSAVGIFGLTSLGFARIFNKNSFKLSHLVLILLYFGNWLPYALIERVMYLYHYIPAYIFGLLAFVLLLHDFIIPRLRQLFSRFEFLSTERFNGGMFIAGIAFLLMVIMGFFYYAPFTYLLPLEKDEFYNRVLIKEWNMEWPGE